MLSYTHVMLVIFTAHAVCTTDCLNDCTPLKKFDNYTSLNSVQALFKNFKLYSQHVRAPFKFYGWISEWGEQPFLKKLGRLCALKIFLDNLWKNHVRFTVNPVGDNHPSLKYWIHKSQIIFISIKVYITFLLSFAMKRRNTFWRSCAKSNNLWNSG